MKLNVGKPVTGRELIGRKQEAGMIIDMLRAGQNVVIIAPRRFGKTSLLLEILRKLKTKGYYTGFINVFTISNLKQLALEICSEILRNQKLDRVFRRSIRNLAEIFTNVKLKEEIRKADFLLSFARTGEDVRNQLGNAIDYINEFSERHNKQSCFGFDEFADLSKHDSIDVPAVFRDRVLTQKNSSYLFSGSNEAMMEKLFISKKSPFYKQVKIVKLGFLDTEECLKFIKKKFDRNNLQYKEKTLREINEFIKGHPYYLRLFMQEYYLLSEEKRLDLSTKKHLENMLNAEITYIEKVWDEISASGELRYALNRIISSNGRPWAGTEDSRFNLSRAIKELKGKGEIFKVKDRYIFSDPLLEFYIKNKVLKLT